MRVYFAEYTWSCRFCEHLKDTSKPRQEYIGTCEFGLAPETCGKFELAKCYEGHDPREEAQIKQRG